MPTYAVRELGFTPSVALFGAALTGLISFAFAPFVGKLSDVVGRKPSSSGAASRWSGEKYRPRGVHRDRCFRSAHLPWGWRRFRLAMAHDL